MDALSLTGCYHNIVNLFNAQEYNQIVNTICHPEQSEGSQEV